LPPRESARVVIADDHPLVLETVTRVLAEHFDVLAAVSDGTAALDAARRLDPDVVVLDLQMPGLNGLQVASGIRAAGLRAKVVFLSDNDSDDYVLAALLTGGLGFSSKRRLLTDLVAAIEHATAGRSFVPSPSVLHPWSCHGHHHHHVQLYQTDAFLLEQGAKFFQTALDAGDSVIAIASDAHLAGFDDRMTACGLKPELLLDQGRYTRVTVGPDMIAQLVEFPMDAAGFAAWFDPLIEKAGAAAISADRHVAVIGEVAPMLCEAGHFETALALEQLAADYLKTKPVSLLCTYAAQHYSRSGDDFLGQLWSAHATVVSSEPHSNGWSRDAV